MVVTRILIAEDEPRIASLVEDGLRANGFTTTLVEDARRATSLLGDERFDLLVVDVDLVNDDLTDHLRRDLKVPVIVLTTGDDASSRRVELAGPRDHVTKPFRFEELLARVRVLLGDTSSAEHTVLRAGGLVLDLRTRRASIGSRSAELTAREFALLETFIRHPDQVLSREQLLGHVWGYAFTSGSNVVDVYIGGLRRKLGLDVIETVRGAGYRLHPTAPGPAESAG
jgi:two-component system, OmpR family, copper resistance phosphate regulon response regulator CusR